MCAFLFGEPAPTHGAGGRHRPESRSRRARRPVHRLRRPPRRTTSLSRRMFRTSLPGSTAPPPRSLSRGRVRVDTHLGRFPGPISPHDLDDRGEPRIDDWKLITVEETQQPLESDEGVLSTTRSPRQLRLSCNRDAQPLDGMWREGSAQQCHDLRVDPRARSARADWPLAAPGEAEILRLRGFDLLAEIPAELWRGSAEVRIEEIPTRMAPRAPVRPISRRAQTCRASTRGFSITNPHP